MFQGYDTIFLTDGSNMGCEVEAGVFSNTQCISEKYTLSGDVNVLSLKRNSGITLCARSERAVK